MSEREEELDRKALRIASERYGIPLDEPGAEAQLRESSVFAWVRLRLAVRELWFAVKRSFGMGSR